MSPSLILSLVAAGWLAQAPVPPAQGKLVSANLKVRVSTSTHMPDGRVLTASASDWPLRLNESVVAYAASGKTMCEPKVASLQQPELPVPGWRVEITPIREGAGELEVRVHWRQLGLARKREFERMTFGPTATLTLRSGDKVVLDYVTGNSGSGRFVVSKEGFYERFGTLRAGTVKATPAASDCTAVGMSLEVGLEPAKTDAIVEAELWLVRPNRDGTERADRQVLRLPVGQPASRYFFDEARLAGSTMSSDAFAEVSGELSAVAIENGKIRLNFKVNRRDRGSPQVDLLGIYPDLVAAPGEVLAFQLPPPASKTQPLSIRLRANLMR